MPTATWQAFDAGDAGAEDDDLGGPHARRAREQDAAAAVLGLQAPGADLHREAAGDLAHRRQERERAVVELQRLVGERAHAPLAQHRGELGIGREVQVGEEHDVRSQQRVLRRAAAPSP